MNYICGGVVGLCLTSLLGRHGDWTGDNIAGSYRLV